MNLTINLLQGIKAVKKMLVFSKNNNIKNLEFLNALAFGLKHEYIPKNKILMKYGDKGDKYYIILRGSVSIIIPTAITFFMTEIEYIKSLYNLRTLEEYGLISKILGENKKIYDFTEEDVNYLFHSIALEKENDEKEKRKSIGHAGQRKSILKHLPKAGFLNKLIASKGSLFNLNDLQYDNCTTEDYCLRVLPNASSQTESDIHKKVIWYGYKNIVSLQAGDKFGDLALGADNLKRNASIVTNENCDFGTLLRQYYHNIIIDFNERLMHTNIEYIYSYKIFNTIDEIRKNYNNFVYTTFKIGDNILEQSHEIDYIYFILSGDFDVKFNGNLKYIIAILNNLTGYSIKNSSSEQEYLHEYGIQLSKLKSKKNYTLYQINDKCLIGLKDFVYEESLKSLFTVTCKSHFGDGFRIDRSKFMELVNFNGFNRKSLRIIQNKKKTILQERLNKLKISMIQSIMLNSNHKQGSFLTSAISTGFHKDLVFKFHKTLSDLHEIENKNSKKVVEPIHIRYESNAPKIRKVTIIKPSKKPLKINVNQINKETNLLQNNIKHHKSISILSTENNINNHASPINTDIENPIINNSEEIPNKTFIFSSPRRSRRSSSKLNVEDKSKKKSIFINDFISYLNKEISNNTNIKKKNYIETENTLNRGSLVFTSILNSNLKNEIFPAYMSSNVNSTSYLSKKQTKRNNFLSIDSENIRSLNSANTNERLNSLSNKTNDFPKTVFSSNIINQHKKNETLPNVPSLSLYLHINRKDNRISRHISDDSKDQTSYNQISIISIDNTIKAVNNKSLSIHAGNKNIIASSRNNEQMLPEKNKYDKLNFSTNNMLINFNTNITNTMKSNDNQVKQNNLKMNKTQLGLLKQVMGNRNYFNKNTEDSQKSISSFSKKPLYLLFNTNVSIENKEKLGVNPNSSKNLAALKTIYLNTNHSQLTKSSFFKNKAVNGKMNSQFTSICTQTTENDCNNADIKKLRMFQSQRNSKLKFIKK